MKLAKVKLGDGSSRCAIVDENDVRLLDLTQLENVRWLSDILNHKDPAGLARFLVDQTAKAIPLADVTFLAPIDRQEVWAAGVTYKRSQIARMVSASGLSGCS